jgi:hypothetical protein
MDEDYIVYTRKQQHEWVKRAKEKNLSLLKQHYERNRLIIKITGADENGLSKV